MNRRGFFSWLGEQPTPFLQQFVVTADVTGPTLPYETVYPLVAPESFKRNARARLVAPLSPKDRSWDRRRRG